MNIKKYVLPIRFWFDFKLFIAIHYTHTLQNIPTIYILYTILYICIYILKNCKDRAEIGPDQVLKK